MYSNYPNYINYSNVPMNYNNQNFYKLNNRNDRLVGGGFLAPFLLGGITGGLLAPAFYPRPNYNNYYPYPVTYYYGGYYR